MNNYNVDYECTYINLPTDSDNKYREELLKVFNLDKIDTSDELTKKVDELYDDNKLQYILNDIFKLIREKVPFLSICKDDCCFMFLFGYETFYIMQTALREYKSKNDISKETLDELKNKIEYI